MMLTCAAHAETINVLNTHAEIRASNEQDGSEKFYQLFADFVRLLKESDYDFGYLQDIPTPLTQAYGSFIAYNYELKKLRPKREIREVGGRRGSMDGVGA